MMSTGMVIMMLVMLGVMLIMRKDGMMMMSHDKHEKKTEESKTSPNKTNESKIPESNTEEGIKNTPEEHKHTH